MLSFPLMLSTNIYLLEENSELILIDAALNPCSKNIINYITKLNKPLSGIILTHAHDDHIGALNKLLENFPSANVYIGNNEEKLFKSQCLKKWNQIIPYNKLKDGDLLSSLQVIETPGHTQGSISLFNLKDSSLICGDLFHSKGGLTISGDTRLLFPFPSFATESLLQSIKSSEKLKNYNINNLYCGHGKVVENFKDKINILIERAKNRPE